jgi:hypothetical protein
MTPVLVVHGIATHDKTEFELRVSCLQTAIELVLPEVQLIPVFWGDLGARSSYLSDCLPLLEKGRWTTRAAELFSGRKCGCEVRSVPEQSNRERGAIITGSKHPEFLVRGGADGLLQAVVEALRQTTHLQKIDDPEILKAVGDILTEALIDPEGSEGFEVRGLAASMQTTESFLEKAKGVILGIDRLVGRVLEDGLGFLNQRLRASLMSGIAATLGDIIIYHGNKGMIQRRLWDAIEERAPGYGTQARPIGLIAHSLGGVVSFDAAVSPANNTPLYLDSFVTFGSQPAFFEIIFPRVSGAVYRTNHPIRLPATIKKWFNLWNVVDLFAFTAGTVFRLNDGTLPVDIPVEDPFSVMLDENLWLHSIYWTTDELREALVRAFR